MNNELISLIIPIYNTPINYLKKCLNSIYTQTYKNLEIILIDDGSKEEYKKVYKSSLIKNKNNIKLIEKKNTGVSDTRNLGINCATGKYIMFIDSDDYIDKDYISKMYSSLKNKNVEVSISGATIVDSDGKKISTQLCNIAYNKKLTIKDIDEQIINYPYFTCVKMLIKKDKIKHRFNSKIKYGEDLLFAFELLQDSSFVYLNNCDYFYVQNGESATHNYTYESIIKYLDNNLEVFNLIEKSVENSHKMISIRLFTKFELALRRYAMNKECNYKKFKKLYSEYIKKYDYTKIKNKDIYFLNLINRIMVIILNKRLLKIYYLIIKIKRNIKRKR